jgi:hypothetical protein
MHLAKMVKTINGCKESIWIQYKRLYGDELSLPLVMQTTRPDEVQAQALKPDPREAFEAEWSNWELWVFFDDMNCL